MWNMQARAGTNTRITISIRWKEFIQRQSDLFWISMILWEVWHKWQMQYQVKWPTLQTYRFTARMVMFYKVVYHQVLGRAYTWKLQDPHTHTQKRSTFCFWPKTSRHPYHFSIYYNLLTYLHIWFPLLTWATAVFGIACWFLIPWLLQICLG